MMHCMYTGATGLKTHSAGLSNVAENLSNVNTIGYKQHNMLFGDLISRDLASPTAAVDGINQLGMGSAPMDVRTIFTQGAFENSSEKTDLALSGKGFFQVVDDNGVYQYTRAGNFRFDDDGYLRDPSDFTLSGYKMINGQKSQDIEPIQFKLNDASSTMPAKATSQITAVMNIGSSDDNSSNPENPYFALMQSWDATAQPPLSHYTTTQPIQVYDEAGNSHDLQLYIDGAPSLNNGTTTYEYVLAMTDPSEDTSLAAGTRAAGLLMSGTLSFDETGSLINMSAFTPERSEEANNMDLTTWKPATLAGGLPQFTANFAGSALAQNMTLNLGVQNVSDAWTNAPNIVNSAADVTGNIGSLPTMTTVARENNTDVTSARDGYSELTLLSQDGYKTGQLVSYEILQDGTISGQYNNGVQQDLYSIPVFNFTSEDGLRNEGKNHFSATQESGDMRVGEAGTSNFASIQSTKIENSNVDYEKEMVQMILVQRGFQMNSKVVTTADTMLQRAVDLKRN